VAGLARCGVEGQPAAGGTGGKKGALGRRYPAWQGSVCVCGGGGGRLGGGGASCRGTCESLCTASLLTVVTSGCAASCGTGCGHLGPPEGPPLLQEACREGAQHIGRGGQHACMGTSKAARMPLTGRCTTLTQHASVRSMQEPAWHRCMQPQQAAACTPGSTRGTGSSLPTVVRSAPPSPAASRVREGAERSSGSTAPSTSSGDGSAVASPLAASRSCSSRLPRSTAPGAGASAAARVGASAPAGAPLRSPRKPKDVLGSTGPVGAAKGEPAASGAAAGALAERTVAASVPSCALTSSISSLVSTAARDGSSGGREFGNSNARPLHAPAAGAAAGTVRKANSRT
jgi:hypothetical protein